ncbi:MAG: HD domain-containing protein [Bacteroidota bacterium]|nr:HD domain-containing protein [Bacteroidota bacterium]
MDFKKAKEYVITRLTEESSLDHFYHNSDHTLDVWRSAKRLCRMEGLEEHDQLLVETAAVFHDIGMLDTYRDHEMASAAIAMEALPEFGYSGQDIDAINKMIITTRLPQSAQTLNEQVLCDADLDYLGRDDFFMIALRLRQEWNILKIRPTTLKEWYELQINFLENHHFFTKSAQFIRNDKKSENLQQIKELCTIDK